MAQTKMVSPALARYAFGGHATVEGWLGTGALSLTIAISERQLTQGTQGGVAEIGVHHGRYFIALALLRRSGELGLAVDVFEDQHLNVDWSGLGNRGVFLSNLSLHGVDLRELVVHKGDSLTMESRDLLRLSRGQRFRLFSVDGGHRVVNVVHDLTIVAGALAAGGVVILDDFFNPDWPGVNEGLFRFLADSPTLAPFCYADNKLFLCAADLQSEWLEWVRMEIAPSSPHVKQVALSNYPVLHVIAPELSSNPLLRDASHHERT